MRNFRIDTTTAMLVCASLAGLWLVILGTVGAVVLAIFYDGLSWIGAAAVGVGLLVMVLSEVLLVEVDPIDGGWP